MKAGTIPFPRQFGPGNAGLDVRAVKRALAKLGYQGLNVKTNSFGKPAQEALGAFKTAYGLVGDPIYTVEAHEKLKVQFDAEGASWMNEVFTSLLAQRQRDSYVWAWQWAIEHHGENVYEEVRPIPFGLAPFETTTTIRTDCSGESALLAKWQGLPDPSGLGFDGAGNTGTILAACSQVSVSQAQPADLIVYRAGSWDRYGHHVVAILKRLSATDFEIGSNGHQGDPGLYTHSAMAATQGGMGYPLSSFCRFLPISKVKVT